MCRSKAQLAGIMGGEITSSFSKIPLTLRSVFFQNIWIFFEKYKESTFVSLCILGCPENILATSDCKFIFIFLCATIVIIKKTVTSTTNKIKRTLHQGTFLSTCTHNSGKKRTPPVKHFWIPALFSRLSLSLIIFRCAPAN